MPDIVEFNTSQNEMNDQNTQIVAMTNTLLVDMRSTEIPTAMSLSIPIAKLSTLGAGVSSLIPVFNTVTQTLSMDTHGLYQLANESIGDTLKVAKDGNFLGAFKTADGASKFAKLKAVDSVGAQSKSVMYANPATMMMAVALFSIENQLDHIAEMEKQIISFLQIEKEAEMEADVITLSEIINKYKDRTEELLIFHRFSIVVWGIWLIPYILGMIMGSGAV